MPRRQDAPPRRRILDAARRLYVDQGIREPSTEDLVREAGVSKATLYKVFGGKAGVLAGLVEDALAGSGIPEHPVPHTLEDFAQAVVALGCTLTRARTRPAAIRFDQLMHEQARQYPEVAAAYYRGGYEVPHRSLTALLEHGIAQGFVTLSAPADVLADHLLCIWDGHGAIRRRLGVEARPTIDVDEWIRTCTTALLRL